MASKRNTDNMSSVIKQNIESRDLKTAVKEPEQENMKTVSFQIKPSEYEALRTHFDVDLGMKIGQGIRFVLHQYYMDKVK